MEEDQWSIFLKPSVTDRLRKWVYRIRYGDDSPVTQEFLDKIIYGENVFESPWDQTDIQEGMIELLPKIQSASSHLERVKLIARMFTEDDLQALSDTVNTKFVKTTKVAMKLLKRGKRLNKMKPLYGFFARVSWRVQKHYKRSNPELAFRCCNLAFSFAPTNHTSLLVKLHIARAIFFTSIHEESVLDDECAHILIHGSPDPSEVIPKKDPPVLCEARIEWIEDLKADIKPLQVFRDEVLFKIKDGEQNPRIPAALNSITIVQDKVKGRILVATKDIRAGTTVIVEEPYVSILKDTIRWSLKHCSKCHKATLALLPCENCVFVSYCSEKCRVDDFESGHKYECECINYFHAMNLDIYSHLGFKAICRAGPEYMYKLFKQPVSVDKNTNEDNDNGIKGFDPETGLYSSDSYYQIYNLASHIRPNTLGIRSWFSYVLSKLLELETDFFDEIDKKNRKDFQLFLASTLLYHSTSIPYNLMSLWSSQKIERPKKKKLVDFIRKSQDIPEENPVVAGSSGIYPVSTLLMHSCDPNTLRVHLNGKVAIVTGRSIMAGETLTMSYGYQYHAYKWDVRNEAFNGSYFFTCDCHACTQNWPTISEMSDKYDYLCPDCAKRNSYLKNCVSGLYVLTKRAVGIMYCSNCGNEFKSRILDEQVQKYRNMVKSATKLLCDEFPKTLDCLDAIPILLECIEFFECRVKAPFLPCIKARGLLQMAFEKVVTTDTNVWYYDWEAPKKIPNSNLTISDKNVLLDTIYT